MATPESMHSQQCAPRGRGSWKVACPSNSGSDTPALLLQRWSLSLRHFLNTFMEIQSIYHKVHLFNVYDSLAFSIVIELCNQNHNLILERFLSPLKKSVPISSHFPLACSLFIPSPQPQATTSFGYILKHTHSLVENSLCSDNRESSALSS